MARTKVAYLGDGAYVGIDELRRVVLWTSDGINETNTIVLEPEVLNSFSSWIKRVLEDRG